MKTKRCHVVMVTCRLPAAHLYTPAARKDRAEAMASANDNEGKFDRTTKWLLTGSDGMHPYQETYCKTR